MSKDKPTPLLAINMWSFYTVLMRRPAIILTYIVIFFSTVFIVHTSILQVNDINDI